jgi:hypothetical protein
VRRVSKTLGTALAVFLLAAGVAACGGDDSSTSTDSSGQGQLEAKSGAASTKGDAQGGNEGKSGEGGAKSAGSAGGGKGQPDGGSAADFVPRQHNDSGGGSEQYQVKGGDNSVQEFGEEADDPEFEAAATALHNFLDARAEGNWAAACEYMSAAMIESFEKLATEAKQVDDTSCGGILASLTNPAAKASMRTEAEQADIGSLRVEDDRSFLIYTTGGDVILAMPMASEDGAWKVASLTGTPLN